MSNPSSLPAGVQRARRLVQLIDRQLSADIAGELVASPDQFDLVKYRLVELAALEALPPALNEVSAQLPGKDAFASMPGQAVIATAKLFIERTKSVLREMGADPGDRSLDPKAHRLDSVRRAVLTLEPSLKDRGVEAVYVFGSVARGDDGPDADIDIAIDVTDEAASRFSLIDLAWIRRTLQTELEVKVDVVERDSWNSGFHQRVEPDLVKIF